MYPSEGRVGNWEQGKVRGIDGMWEIERKLISGRRIGKDDGKQHERRS